DAEGPGQHVIFDVATARPMADAHVGAAMMAPGAAARNVEESKVATYGDVPPHQLVTFGVGVYGGLGPAAVAFLKRTQWRFSGRRYLAEDAVEADEVDEEGDEEGSGGEDARAGRGGSMGWKEQSGASPEQARALAEEACG
ncbi:hypothetical protein CYMTET_8114, partial [Cymbomonas tetramitiformis]